MKKIIKFKVAYGEGEEITLYDRRIMCGEEYLQSNVEIAKREAYNGEYTIEDGEQPEATPTDAERIADLEEAMDMILSGVTE